MLASKAREGLPRAIIVKFLSYQSKMTVLKNRRRLKGKRLYVNEDLTKINKDLFDTARKVLSDLSVWTADGKVLVKLVNNKVVRIKSKEDILQYQ